MPFSKDSLSASRWASKSPRPLRPIGNLNLLSAAPGTAVPELTPLASPSKAPTYISSSPPKPSPSPHHHHPPPVLPPPHAPSPTSTTTAINGANPNPALLPKNNHLVLYTRLLPRLKWRASLLLTSLRFATNPHENGVGMDEVEADVQFRIEFFEFYVLLERILVCLLAAVGVRVGGRSDKNEMPQGRGRSPAKKGGRAQSPMRRLGIVNDGGVRDAGESSNGGGLIGDSKNFPASTTTGTSIRNGINAPSKWSSSNDQHAFHANILLALSTHHNNPLFEVLGQGKAKEYIALAKDLRNGWKESAVETSPTKLSKGGSKSRAARSQSPTKQQQMNGYNGASVGGQTVNNPDGGHAPEEDDDDEARRLEIRLKRRYADLLRELKLDEMLRVILLAVEEAGGLADGFVQQQRSSVGDATGRNGAQGGHARQVSVEMVDVMYVDSDERYGEEGQLEAEAGPMESRGMGFGMGVGVGWGGGVGDEMEF